MRRVRTPRIGLAIFIVATVALSVVAYLHDPPAPATAPVTAPAPRVALATKPLPASARPIPPGFVRRDGQTITKELSDEIDATNRAMVAKLMAQGMSEAEARSCVRTFRRLTKAAIALWPDVDGPEARAAIKRLTVGYAWVDLADATDEQIATALVAERARR